MWWERRHSVRPKTSIALMSMISQHGPGLGLGPGTLVVAPWVSFNFNNVASPTMLLPFIKRENK
jgi:hypothetical protein